MKTESIEIKSINTRQVTVTIVGDGDLILNKMNDVNIRRLTAERKSKAKDTDKPNEWKRSSQLFIGTMEHRQTSPSRAWLTRSRTMHLALHHSD